MELEKKFMIKKISSIICLVIVILLFFSSWITVCSKEFKDEFRSEIKEMKEEIDIDADEIEEFEEELEDYGIDFPLKKFVKKAKKIINMVEDVSLSPKEVVSMTLPSYSLLKMTEKYEDNYFFRSSLHSMQEALQVVTIFCTVNTIVWTLALGITIIYIIMHLYNGKGMGLPILILQILGTVIMTLTTYIINIGGKETLGEKVVKLTASPILALVLLIVSFVLWTFAYQDYDTLKKQKSGNGFQNVHRPQSAINSGMTAAAYTSGAWGQAGNGMMGEHGMPQQATRKFCTNCGHEIDPGASFCRECGKPV